MTDPWPYSDLTAANQEIERLRSALERTGGAMTDGVERRLKTLQQLTNQLTAENERLRAALASKLEHMRNEANAQNRRLMAFAHWVIKEGPFNGCNLDGGDVQDKAVELGILTETKYDPAIHGESDSAEPGDQWFVFETRTPSYAPRRGS